MYFKIISYFKFLYHSTNQHGVHSPFVYQFVTKGLYQKTKTATLIDDNNSLKSLSKKEKKILSKIITYFNVDTISFDSIVSENNNALIFIQQLNHKTFFKPKSNYFVVIKDIHQNKINFLNWQKLIKNSEATVTIDLFYFGLIFFRKEQAKEHFIIRV